MRRLIGGLLAAGLVVVGCAEPQERAFEDIEPADRGPLVAVSVPLLASVVEQIVAGHGVVEVVFPDGEPTPLDDAATEQLASADLVLMHDRTVDGSDIKTMSTTGSPAVDVVELNTRLDPQPITPAAWFDPVHMARIALELGDVLAAADDDELRGEDGWHNAAAAVATSLTETFEEAEGIVARVPRSCRRAVGDPDLLAHLGHRFGVTVADDTDDGAADLTHVSPRLAPGETWQDWFVGIAALVATADPDCPAPSPSPTPTGASS